jgi:serine/threonine-protein kinase HipA
VARAHATLLVSVSGVVVGELTRDRAGLVRFAPRAEWEQQGQRPRLGLTFLRDPRPRTAGTGLPPWFENLLPEAGSALRARLAGAHGLREANGFGLLQVLGRDLPGAVELSGGEHAEPDPEPSVAVAESLEGDVPLSQLRFSLAGMQLKFSMSMLNDHLTLRTRAEGEAWIVKLPGIRYPELPRVESATMSWARNAGFDVPPQLVTPTEALHGIPAGWLEDAPEAYAVRRFDRRADGSKVHLEDMCQALDLLPVHKYGSSGGQRVSHDGLLKFVVDVAGEEDGRELARRVGFVIASGNDDAHLKNWSWLWGHADRPRLSPCYDLVSTVSWAERHGWGRSGGPELALALGGERRFARMNSFVLDAHGSRSGCRWAAEEVMAGIERARDAWAASEGAMPELMRAALVEHWERVPLLRGVKPRAMGDA